MGKGSFPQDSFLTSKVNEAALSNRPLLAATRRPNFLM